MNTSRWLLGLGTSVVFGLMLGCAADTASTKQSIGDDQGGYDSDGCTLTQGYWKNHPGDWPVTTLELGNNSYDQAQLLSILGRPVQGNGLLSLSHQLIAAKLNVAAGADDSGIASAIDAADALIGNLVPPPVGTDRLPTGSSLVGQLDDYNNGRTGPGHCDDGPPPPPPPPPPPGTCGDGHLDSGEVCDDGNTVDGDGCNSVCDTECTECNPPPPPPEPRCGDGNLDTSAGETCDDGNTIDGDGCNSICDVECACDHNLTSETPEISLPLLTTIP